QNLFHRAEDGSALARRALREVLLSARRARRLEPAVRQARLASIPVRRSHQGGAAGALARGAFLAAAGVEEVRRAAVTGNPLLSPARLQPRAGCAQPRRRDLRSLHPPGEHRRRGGRRDLSRQGRAHGAEELRPLVSAARRIRAAHRSGVLLFFLAESGAMKVLVLGATSAIAQAAARVWAARGAELFLVGRNSERLGAVADDLRARGGKAPTLAQDLNDEKQHEPLIENALQAMGAIDVVLVAQGLLGDPAGRDEDPAAAELILRT